jgi:tetratricopeptide (TPR) repeat protein
MKYSNCFIAALLISLAACDRVSAPGNMSEPRVTAVATSAENKTMAWQDYQERGITRTKAGDVKGGIDDFTIALKDSPPNAALFFLRGSARLQQKNWKEAADDFQSGLNIDPDNEPLKVLLKKARENMAPEAVQK